MKYLFIISGQERYHSLAPMYYRGAQAAIVVYDITNQVNYLDCKYYIVEIVGIVFKGEKLGERIATTSESKHCDCIIWKQGRSCK